MHRRYIFLIIVLFLLALTSCADNTGTVLPTLLPEDYVPTAIALTAQSLVTENPQPTVEADAATPQITQTETLTPTSTVGLAWDAQIYAMLTPSPPTQIPYANIRFVRPGPLSRVVSPISLNATLVPGAERRARVELWGEDDRLIYRKIFNFSFMNSEGRGVLLNEFNFEISGVAETARLVVQTLDEYGRTKDLASEELILLSVGDEDIYAAGDYLETIVLREPQERVLIQGGKLRVSGWVRIPKEHNLRVELVTADGSIVGSRTAVITPTSGHKHTTFSAEVPYSVGAPEWVRVTVSERGSRLPGPIHVSSVEVLLSP